LADKEQTLFDPFQHRGYWWFPDAPDKKVPGVVSFSPDEISLELFGSLSQRTVQQLGIVTKPLQVSIILGELDDSRGCILHRAMNTGSQFVLRRAQINESYSAKFLFIGAHATQDSELDFAAVDLSYTHLVDWLADLPFGPPTFKKRKGGKTFRIDYSYRFPKRFNIYLSGLRARLTSDFILASGGPGFHSRTQEHVAYIRFQPRNLQLFDWYWERLVDCQYLLTLLIGEPVYPERVLLYCNKESLSQRRSVSLYYTHSYCKPDKAVHPRDMLLPFPTLRHQWPAVASAWFSKKEALRNAYGLFLGPSFAENMYIEFQFLSLIQALEIYSRVIHVGKYMTVQEYEPIKQKLVDSLPQNVDKDWKQSFIAGKIDYGNEFSLNKRLKQILADLEPDTVKLVCNKPAAFSKKVADTRNYYTHYSDKLKEAAASGPHLYWLSQRLRILLMIVLLKELGIHEPLIRTQIANHPKLMQILHLYLRPDTSV